MPLRCGGTKKINSTGRPFRINECVVIGPCPGCEDCVPGFIPVQRRTEQPDVMEREPLTDAEIESDLSLCEKATEGPWVALSRNAGNTTNDPQLDDDFLGWEVDGPEQTYGRGQFHRGHDAAFIAAARTGWPRALVALKEARRDLMIERGAGEAVRIASANLLVEMQRNESESAARADRAEAALVVRTAERDDAREGWQDATNSANEERDHSKAVEADRDEARRMYCLSTSLREAVTSTCPREPRQIADEQWPADADRLFPVGDQ